VNEGSHCDLSNQEFWVRRRRPETVVSRGGLQSGKALDAHPLISPL